MTALPCPSDETSDASSLCSGVVRDITAPRQIAFERLRFEAVPVVANTADQHQPLGGANDGLPVDADAAFIDLERTDGEILRSGDRLVEAHGVERIVAQFAAHPERNTLVQPQCAFDPAAVAPAFLVLADLVAVHRILEEEGEVVEQAPVVVLGPGGQSPVVVGIIERQDLPLGAATQRRVERAIYVRAQRRADRPVDEGAQRSVAQGSAGFLEGRVLGQGRALAGAQRCGGGGRRSARPFCSARRSSSA